jgi:hypothetical protein
MAEGEVSVNRLVLGILKPRLSAVGWLISGEVFLTREETSNGGTASHLDAMTLSTDGIFPPISMGTPPVTMKLHPLVAIQTIRNHVLVTLLPLAAHQPIRSPCDPMTLLNRAVRPLIRMHHDKMLRLLIETHPILSLQALKPSTQ